MTNPNVGPGLTVDAAPARVRPQSALPDGAAWLEPEFDDVRARLGRLEAAEAAHARRNAERRDHYRAALAEHHAAADAAVLDGRPAPEPPTDPGPEPGAVAFTNERNRLHAEVGQVWREHGHTIVARLRERASAEVDEIDAQIEEHEQALRDLRKNRTTPAQRVERLRSLFAPKTRPTTTDEPSEDAPAATTTTHTPTGLMFAKAQPRGPRAASGAPLMPDGKTTVEETFLASQRRRSSRRRTR